jgi:two-component sensor histidine kinase
MGSGSHTTPTELGWGQRRLSRSELERQLADMRAASTAAQTIATKTAILKREGDHRIKNNLQIVSSLLTLQASETENQVARDALSAAAGRIRSIALVHDALQDAGGEDVDLGDMLAALGAGLQAIAGKSGQNKVIVRTGRILAPISVAQPIMLATHELAVNAIRHARPAGHARCIRVTAAATDQDVRVCVADNGVGLPDNFAARHGYGMRLVRMLVRQISGKLEVGSAGGASFTITAPLDGGSCEFAHP